MRCSNDKHHIFAWREVVLESDLAPTPRLVALAMSFDMDCCVPMATRVGPERLAQRTGLSVRAVKSAIQVLRAEDFIVMVKRGGGPLGNTSTHHGLLPSNATSAGDALVQEVPESDGNWGRSGTELGQDLHSAPCAGDAQDLGDLEDLGERDPVLALAQSLLTTNPVKTLTARRDELAARLRQFDPAAAVAVMETLPKGCFMWPNEVINEIKKKVTTTSAAPTCERCKGTGQTSTGYPCGCPSTRRWAS